VRNALLGGGARRFSFVPKKKLTWLQAKKRTYFEGG